MARSTFGSTAKRRWSRFKQRRSEPGFDPSSSVHTSFASIDTCLGANLDGSAHALAINAAQDREKKLQESLPQSLFEHGQDCIAPFRREEISLGRFLGSGEYANVFEVLLFRLQADSAQDGALSTREQKKKQRMKKDETYRQSGNSRYALKHFKGDYLRKHSSDEYVQAAGDLASEAKFLSSLSHPNIIKLRGITHSGPEGFGDGPIGYFLIIDRLNETLDGRIRKWSAANDDKPRRSSSLNKKIANLQDFFL